MENLFTKIPSTLSEEHFTELLQGKNFRLERIVSRGQATPAGKWLREPDAEWVVVLSGRARILFKGEPQPRVLGRGDFLNIPAGQAHRVEWTDPGEQTVWLAIHYAL